MMFTKMTGTMKVFSFSTKINLTEGASLIAVIYKNNLRQVIVYGLVIRKIV